LWAWVFKSYAKRDWARFAKLYGQPLRLGRYHAGASPEDVAALKEAVFGMGSDAAAVIPKEMALEFVEAGGKSASADLYHKLVEYLDRQVSKAVLGQTMTTDDGSSLAQAQVHNEVRLDLLRADARAISATLGRDLVALNLGDAPPPRLHLEVEEPEDMAALAEQVAKLAAAGVAIPQAWVRERFGIPDPVAGETVIGEKTRPAQDGETAAQSRAVHALHATPDTPELQANRLEIEAAPAWAEIVNTIRRIVEEAESLEQLRDALLAAYGALPTDRLAEVMAIGFAAADLAGRFEVREESDGG